MKLVNGTRTCLVTAAFLMAFAGVGIAPASGAIVSAEKLAPHAAVTGNASVGHDQLGPRDATIVTAGLRATTRRAPAQRRSPQRARNNGPSTNQGGNGGTPKPSTVFKPNTSSTSKGPMYMMPLECFVQPHLCF